MNAQRRAGYDPGIGKTYSDPDGKVGILTDVLGETAYLRPVHGGREWTVAMESVQPVADSAQELSAKVAEANRRSRGEL